VSSAKLQMTIQSTQSEHFTLYLDFCHL